MEAPAGAATSYGRLIGLRQDGCYAFLGVPFARPPRGVLRFAAPRPLEGWSGALDATRHPPAAPQNPGDGLSSIFHDQADGFSEDCLRLNLWTPGIDDARRPVLVWIHGGRFLHGSASERPFDGRRLASRRDVVIVAVQYRLGPFGFLHLGEDAEHPSNLGLRDQIAALEWVRREIAAFGGDPDNVTLFGQSAGAISAGVLMSAPAARGLFHRAILQSGPPVALSPSHALPVSQTLLRTLGCGGRGLGAQGTEQILAAEGACFESPGQRPLGLPYMPVRDGDLVPHDPFDAVTAGLGSDVPLLIGTTRDEMTAYLLLDPETQALDEGGLQRRCESLLPDKSATATAIDVYRSDRVEHGEPSEPRDLWFAMLADRHVRHPSLRLAEAVARRGQAAYCYRFDWVSPFMEGALGACHSLEVPFVFGTLAAPGLDLFTGCGPESLALADYVQGAWVRFARTGVPGGDWPAYDAASRTTMLLDRTPRLVQAPGEAQRRFWEAALG